MRCQLLPQFEQLCLFGESFGVVAPLAVLVFFFGRIPEDAEDAHATYLQEHDVKTYRPAAAEELRIGGAVRKAAQQRHQDGLAGQQDDPAEGKTDEQNIPVSFLLGQVELHVVAEEAAAEG